MKNILVMINPSKVSGRGVLQGILKYSATRFDWSINVLEPTESGWSQMLSALANNWVDGIVTSELENQLIREKLETSRIPLVVIGTRGVCLPRRKVRMCTVSFDERKIGRMGASHLLSTGRFKVYAFVPHSFPYLRTLSARRAEGFRAVISKHRGNKRIFRWSGDTALDMLRLGSWIKKLPKPAAIMAADDNHAQMVATAAGTAGVAIPDQVRLIGVDNNVLFCTNNRAQISSIATDFVEEGETAAAELVHILNKGRAELARYEKICRSYCVVVQRESTSPLPPGLSLVNRARDFINMEASERITPSDVAARMGVSRRLLDLRFKQFAGTTLLKAITSARLEYVYKLLTTSKDPIAAISRLAGFNNINYLKFLFRKHYGMTMRDARRRALESPQCIAGPVSRAGRSRRQG
ncbi:MAG: substrate-binding domain-containing protein [Kiritimatiellae bacterium]|nr:substrate-binding domain-containing protein [Kiritimatiellia bacterium]